MTAADLRARRLRALAAEENTYDFCLSDEERADIHAGAEAIERMSQTCGSCRHVDTASASAGSGLCLGPTGAVSGWVPLHARCDHWEPTT